MRIGVLTGGGDCPGLNAAIRAVVYRAQAYGDSVMGIRHGWLGLLGEGDLAPLDTKAVSRILPLGGTILGTSRANPFKEPRYQEELFSNLNRYGIEALITIGGEDTLGVAARLSEMGVRVVGIPKTMDNDIAETDYCIGFDSAVANVVEALDKLHDTASAHHRVMVVEVMGRDVGWLATIGGIAGGADFVVIPEMPASLDEICDHVRDRWASGEKYSVLVVAEGATPLGLPEEPQTLERDDFGHARLDQREIGHRLAKEIERRTGLETRVSVLGHVQRGGTPTPFDRVLATRLGVAAVDLLHAGSFGVMPALKGNRIVAVPLSRAVARKKVDLALYELSRVFYREKTAA